MMKKITFLIFAVIGAVAFISPVLAWTNPSANPATGGGSIFAEQNAPTNSVRIKADGNVGIGTTNPQAKLHITASGQGIRIDRTPGQSSIKAGSTDGYMMIDSAGQKLGLNWYVADDVILVNGGGKVGIGVTAPTQKLDVAGTVYSTSGGFKFPDGTTQTTAFAGGSQTLSAANVSAGSFGANTGGGNYSFPLASQVGFGNFTIRRISATAIGIYDSAGALAVQFDEL